MNRMYMADSVGDGTTVQPDPDKEQPWYAGHEEDPTFEIGGEKVTLKELQSGYMRQADYTRKTQDVSEMRKQWEASQVQPDAKTKTGAPTAPKTDQEWLDYLQRLHAAIPDPSSEYIGKIASEKADEIFTVNELRRETRQAVKDNSQIVEIFGGRDEAIAIVWDALRRALEKNGDVTADDVCKNLLKGVPQKPSEVKTQTTFKPEREGSPAGGRKKDENPLDEKGEFKPGAMAAALDDARARGLIPKE